VSLYDAFDVNPSEQHSSQKSPEHQNGTVTITTHRLFYIDSQRHASSSFALDLSYITQTEYYAGLFKSSAKVTCHLSGNAVSSISSEQEGTLAQFDSWECEVCAYRNPPGLSPAAARICGLCGVPRATTPIPVSQHLSSSLPSSSGHLSSRPTKQASIACPACTFLNHPSLRSCEICSTELPRLKGELKSAPSSRPISPDLDDDDTSARMVKVSFRKGGDKHFYAVLKRSLKSKAWEVSMSLIIRCVTQFCIGKFHKNVQWHR